MLNTLCFGKLPVGLKTVKILPLDHFLILLTLFFKCSILSDTLLLLKYISYVNYTLSLIKIQYRANQKISCTGVDSFAP